MILSEKTLQELRDMINEKTTYRSGPTLVCLFNKYGFHDTYGYGCGFPSRWVYTDDKLKKVNGTPELDKIIKDVFSPSNFIGRYKDLGEIIREFNQYLVFDGWKILIVGKNIEIHHADENSIVEEIKTQCSTNSSTTKEADFLSVEYSDVFADNLPITEQVKPIITARIKEMKLCFEIKAYLSTVIICGSLLEGILLGVASNFPKEFNSSNSAPKKDGKVLEFYNWTLSQFIDVAFSIGILHEDVKEFSHVLRDFRNYIHPYQQMSTGFYPDEHTAKICMQVLKAAIFQIKEKIIKLQ